MLEQYYRINEATGISIHLLSNGGSVINACSIAINDNRLDITKKVVDLGNVGALVKELPAKSFIALNLSGKGILHKQIDKVEDIDQNNFNSILPNANFDDFYVQNFISGDKSFISVIRKTDADKWIEVLKQQGAEPLTLSLGPFAVQNILSQLNVYDNEVIFNGHIIQRNEQLEWTGYQNKPSAAAAFPLKIESESIDEKLVIAYAMVFQLVLAAKLPAITAEVAPLQTAFQKTLADKKLKVQGFAMLVVFFILLLINFAVFSWLNSVNSTLVDQVSRTVQNTSDMQGIDDQIKQKEALLKELGWDEGINKSKLIDQLAALLPTDISLKKIDVNSIDPSSSRIQKTLKFHDRNIRIVGNSDKIIPVNEWIARVKVQKWVKDVQLDSYTYNTELSTGQFTIMINY